MSQNVSGRSAWSEEMPVGRIDREAFLYTGSDPCWTPRREFKRTHDEDVADCDCVLCGGVGNLVLAVDGSLAIHLDIPEGSHRVCARCMRYGLDLKAEREIASSPDGLVLDGDGNVVRGGVTVPAKYSHLMKG